MTNQGKIDLYRDLIRSACNRYAIMRRELYYAMLDMKHIGDECRSIYMTLIEEFCKTTSIPMKQDIQDLMRAMAEQRLLDKAGGFYTGPWPPTAKYEKTWLQEILADVLYELRKLPLGNDLVKRKSPIVAEADKYVVPKNEPISSPFGDRENLRSDQ